MPSNPSLAEVLESVLESRLADVHTTFPAKVVSYDVTKQTATVRPMVRRPVLAADINEEEDRYEELPEIPNVPIRHPRGNNTAIHIPLSSDDFVWVHVSQYDISTWRSTGALSDPGVALTHDLSSCWAEPGAFPNDSKLDSSKVSSTNITLVNGDFVVTLKNNRAEFGGDSDSAALASKVDSLQTAVNTLIGLYNAHTHVETGGTTDPPGTTGSTSSINFASSRLKTDS